MLKNMDTGSFGAPAGGVSPELQEALQRRSGGSSTSAVTQSAPTYDPNTQPPAPVTASAPGMPQSVGQPTMPGLPSEDSEARLIIKALESRLKSLSKIEEMSGGI